MNSSTNIMSNNKGFSVVKHKKPFKIKRLIFILSFIIVPTIHWLIFYVYININSFAMAFQLRSKGDLIWTFDNFTRFFREFNTPDTEIGLAFKNTFITFAISEGMFVIGFFVSYFLYKKIFMYKIFRTMFFLPGLIAGTIVVSIFKRIVGVDSIIADTIQKALGLEYSPSLLKDSRFANLTVFANLIWLSFPGNMILLGGTFSRIPDAVLESGKIDGVNWLQEAVRIIIPITWPTLSLLLMLSIVGIFGASGNVFLLTTGNYGTMTLSCWMYLQVYNNLGDPSQTNAYNYLSAVGMLLSAVSIALAFGIRKITNTRFMDVQY